MSWDPLVFGVVTGFWSIITILLPLCVPRGPNKSIIQLCLILTGICCWTFWFCCYVAQMNPLIGPKLHNDTYLIAMRQWNGFHPV